MGLIFGRLALAGVLAFWLADMAVAGTPMGGMPPVLDSVMMCENSFRVQAPDARIDECVAAERRAFDYLRGAYPGIPLRVRERCERLSRKNSRGFGSYAFIQGCVDLK